MLFRPCDSQGDMIPIARKGQLFCGSDAVTEAIKSRMRLHRGEWFEDNDIGSPVLDLLTKGKVTEDQMGVIAHQIVGYISETTGVKSVQSSQPSYNRIYRTMTLPCTITPTSGEAFHMEVSTST